MIFCLAIGACSGPDSGNEFRNTIHYYQFSLPRDREAFDHLLNGFKQKHPGIRVELHTLPTATDDQHQFYLTHAAGGSRIDVFAMDVVWLAEFAEAGLLMPVDAVLNPSEWREFFPSSVRAATHRGKKYGLPLFIDGGLLYSRKDLLEKYGYEAPPATWEELVAVSRHILKKENDPNLQGLVWQGKQYEGLICNFIEFLPAATRLQDEADSSALRFDQPAVRETLRFMRDLVFVHRVSSQSVFAMSEEESRQVFQNGNAVFMRNWPYAWRLAQREGSPVAGKVQVSRLPGPGKGEEGHGALGGFLIGINRHTPNPQAAIAWARYLTGRAAQKILWHRLGLAPARKSVFPELRSTGFPVDVLERIMDTTVPRPVTPFYIPLSQSMQAYISGSLAGVYSIDRAVRLVDADAKRMSRVFAK